MNFFKIESSHNDPHYFLQDHRDPPRVGMDMRRPLPEQQCAIYAPELKTNAVVDFYNWHQKERIKWYRARQAVGHLWGKGGTGGGSAVFAAARFHMHTCILAYVFLMLRMGSPVSLPPLVIGDGN